MPETLAPDPRHSREPHRSGPLPGTRSPRPPAGGLARAGRIARTAETLTAIGFLPEDAAWFTPDPSPLEQAMEAAGSLAVAEASPVPEVFRR